nr:uncharacterized protein LOC131790211 [Pocillopora verrucosa]
MRMGEFNKEGEEVAIERHRSRVPVDKEAHRGVSELKKHLTEFLGLKEQAHQYGIGGFSLKLFRLAKSPAGKCENFAIVTDGQWQLELPNLISDESSSELNAFADKNYYTLSNERQQGDLQKFQDGRAELALVVRLPDFQKS